MTTISDLRLGFFSTGAELKALRRAVASGIKTVRLIGDNLCDFALTSYDGERVVSSDMDLLVHLFGGVEEALKATGAHDPLLAARLAKLFAVHVPHSVRYGMILGDRPAQILPRYNLVDQNLDDALQFIRIEAMDECMSTMDDAADKKAQRWPPNSSNEFVAELMRYKAPSAPEIHLMRDFSLSVVRMFDVSLFTTESAMGTRTRVFDDRIELHNNGFVLQLQPADIVFLMGGYERFLRFLQVTSDVSLRRMQANPLAANNARDGESLSALYMLAVWLKSHTVVEADWRRDGPRLALQSDTGAAVQEAPEAPVAKAVSKRKRVASA